MKNRNLDHKDHWQSPPQFYKKLNDEFDFDFDPCPLNHDLTKWDGLLVDWGKRNYVNPPYSQKLKEAFVDRAVREQAKGNTSVMLLPVSTSTVLFHTLIEPNAIEIRFVKGRINFIGINAKGQFVNYHLIQEVDKDESIDYFTVIEPDGQPPVIQIPKYVKNSGQHDSMIVIF